MNTAARVREVMGNVFNCDIPERATPDNVPDWDSMGHLHLMMELEKEFGIQFETTEILEHQSLLELCGLVTKHLLKRSGR